MKIHMKGGSIKLSNQIICECVIYFAWYESNGKWSLVYKIIFLQFSMTQKTPLFPILKDILDFKDCLIYI